MTTSLYKKKQCKNNTYVVVLSQLIICYLCLVCLYQGASPGYCFEISPDLLLC